MASTTRNIFTLGEYNDSTLAGEGVSVDSVFTAYPPVSLTDYGYFSSGYNGSSPGITTKTDRVTFATDTTQSLPSSPILQGNKDGTTLTSLTNLYAAGGWDYQTRVYRMNYASETWTNLPDANRMVKKQRQTGNNAVGPKTAGYMFMGDDPDLPGPEHSTVQKIVFSTESWSQLPNYPYKSTWSMGAGNQTRGIISGGNKSNGDSKTSQSYKFTFASETYASVPGMSANASGPGNGERSESAAAGNEEYQWITGGRMPHGMTSTSIKYTYSTDSWDRIPTISRSRRWLQAAGNTSQGYWAGGDSPSPAYSTTDKITYATDTPTAVPGANLTQARSKQFATSPRMNGLGASATPGEPPFRWVDDATQGPDVGYVTMGSASSSMRSSTERLDMVTDTSMSQLPGGNVPFPGMQGGCSFGNNSNGITATGGNQPDMTTDYTYVNKFTYSTETFSSLSGYPGSQTAEGRGYAAGATGYYVGGFVNMSFPADLSSVNKFAFATDTWSESPSPLNDARYWFGNIQNNTEGWALGGYHPSKSSSEKLTFATDTWSSESSTLPSDAKRYYIGGNGSGDATAGYWAGGHPSPGSNKVWKLEYATGTVSNEFDLTPSSPADIWTLNTGMANESKGYFAGGYWSGGSSEVSKFPYATETASNVNPGMNQTRQGAFSFGPRKLGSRLLPPIATPTKAITTTPNPSLSTEGYWSGGYAGGGTPGVRSITDRLTFATDTTSRLPGSNCPARKHWASGSSSATKGYSNGGYEGWESPRTSNIYSLTYASGTWATAATLGETRGKTASINSLLYSWTGGGGNSDPATYTSKIDRLTFATETPSKNILQSANPFQWATGVGNNEAGYFCNGKIDSQSGTTIVEKLTYSTDSIALTPGLHVSGSSSPGSRVNSTMAIGTGDIGYIMGGRSPDRSTVNKITYATDTRSLGTNLWSAVHSGSGLSSPLAGYLTGQTPGTASDAYKMPFASETWTYTGPANASPSSGQEKTGFGAGMNGNAYPASPNVI